MENGKRLVPIFCDVKPSELRVRDDGSRPDAEIEKFRLALEEAKCTVGLTFDTVRGYVCFERYVSRVIFTFGVFKMNIFYFVKSKVIQLEIKY